MTVTTSANIWDVALQQYGGAEGINWLLEDNPGLIDQDGLPPEGRRSYSVRPGQQRAFVERFPAQAAARRNPTVYRSGSEQTIWDVALQHYGSAEGIAWLLEDNPALVSGIGILQEGRKPHVLRQSRINELVWRRMVDYIPATGLEPAVQEEWAILVDDEGNALVDDEGNALGTFFFNLIN